MWRSEVSALRWADGADGDGVLVTIPRGKTNQEGETKHQGSGILQPSASGPPSNGRRCDVYPRS